MNMHVAPIPAEATSTAKRRNKIFTKEVLAEVELLVKQGLNKQQIAGRLGCKASSLQTVACQNRISLCHPDKRKRRPIEITMQVPLEISAPALSALHKAARAKGMPCAKLVADLLEVIATDNLYDAVLDREVA